jgi:hypothetical protein
MDGVANEHPRAKVGSSTTFKMAQIYSYIKFAHMLFKRLSNSQLAVSCHYFFINFNFSFVSLQPDSFPTILFYPAGKKRFEPVSLLIPIFP